MKEVLSTILAKFSFGSIIHKKNLMQNEHFFFGCLSGKWNTLSQQFHFSRIIRASTTLASSAVAVNMMGLISNSLISGKSIAN